MNQVILIGNLAEDPKTSTTSNGITKCTFRLATQRKYKNPQTGKSDADFHNIIAWRQLGDICAKYLAKGRKCAIRGSIQYRTYESEDGVKRRITEIIAEDVEFLSANAQGSTQSSAPAAPAAQAAAGDPSAGFEAVDDDELPF